MVLKLLLQNFSVLQLTGDMLNPLTEYYSKHQIEWRVVGIRRTRF